MTKLRLDRTTQHGDWFLQEWTVISDDEHRVVSNSKWGSVQIEDGGDRVFDIAGTPVCAGQMAGCAISMGHGPTEDGEECPIDAAWIEGAVASGVNRADLAVNIDAA